MANTFKSFFTGLFGTTMKPQLDADGFLPITNILSVSPQFNDYSREIQKINAVFQSPALLKIFALQCDLFSLGKIKLFSKDKEIFEDPLLNLLANPNPYQSTSQLLWDFMFWSMLGNAYCYVDSNIIDNSTNKIYFLESSKIEWPQNFKNKKDKLLFSKKSEKEIFDTSIIYRYEDGSTLSIPLSKIICITDLTNGTGNWFKGNSRIDAIYKIISNSEAALDAKNINTQYSGKFLVAGTQNPNDISKLPLSFEEKTDIETKMNGNKKVHAVKSMIEIKRFVENLQNLALDESYLSSYFLIGNMFNIPRDVLEAYASATYENQEKARASHVSYTLQPKGNDFLQKLGKRFSYTDKKLVIDWSHLPFMQVFEEQHAKTQLIKIQTFSNLLNQGVSLEEANKYLELNFKTGEKIIDPKNNLNTSQ